MKAEIKSYPCVEVSEAVTVVLTAEGSAEAVLVQEWVEQPGKFNWQIMSHRNASVTLERRREVDNNLEFFPQRPEETSGIRLAQSMSDRQFIQDLREAASLQTTAELSENRRNGMYARLTAYQRLAAALDVVDAVLARDLLDDTDGSPVSQAQDGGSREKAA